jgi:hypothetical protein
MESEDLGKTIFIGLVLIYAEWHGYCKRVGIFTLYPAGMSSKKMEWRKALKEAPISEVTII